MQTVLENPTRYHVIQKQKSQVRQYLNESFQQPSNPGTCLTSPRTPQGQAYLNSNNGTPNTGTGTGNGNGNSYPQHPQNHLQNQHHQQHSFGTGYGGLQTGSQPSASPDTAAMSPGLSSVATSTSEVSFTFFIFSVAFCSFILKK